MPWEKAGTQYGKSLPGSSRYCGAVGRGDEFGSVWHLAGRFLGSLSPAGPAPGDDAWAIEHLLPGEQELWARMSGPDRRHAVGVARQAIRILDDGRAPAGREVVAAALLHDVGKVESDLGTLARAGVTAAGLVVGRTRLVAPSENGGHLGSLRSRARLYLTHDRIGGALIREVGGHPLTASWAEEHHRHPDAWTLDRRVALALKTADGD